MFIKNVWRKNKEIEDKRQERTGKIRRYTEYKENDEEKWWEEEENIRILRNIVVTH